MCEESFDISKRLEAFIKYSPVSVAMLNSGMRFLHASSQWCQEFGGQAELIVGQEFENYHAPISERLRDLLQSGLAGNRVHLDEDPFIRSDGSVQWLRWEVQPWFIQEGQPAGIIVFTEDITEYREAREALRRHAWDLQESKRLIEEQTITLSLQAEDLRAAQKVAEEASRVKSNFFACMSHEIRTPMNGIIGMSDLMSETELTDEQKDYLDSIKHSAEMLLTVINDILDYSKIEAGHMKITSAKVKFPNFMYKTLQPFQNLAAEKKISLETHSRNDIPDEIETDDIRLAQILNNLIGNAIKFTPKEGTIVVELSFEAAEEMLRIAVVDSGIGIPHEVLGTIFEPFKQADVNTTRKYGGTGLGLHITKQLVELMGGQICVYSEPGFGSRFEFTLPVNYATIRTKSTEKSERQNLTH